MDGTFSIRTTVSGGAMTSISVDGHVWQKSYNTLTEPAVETAELRIISDGTVREISALKKDKTRSLTTIDLEELPKRDFHRVR